MDKKYSKYMTYGKLVRRSGTDEVYKLIDDMGHNGEVAVCVNISNWERYRLLKVWEYNSVGLTDEQCAEMESYVTKLNVADIEPHNLIRFVDPNYKTMFYVIDLGEVLLNGVARHVVYLDDTHFKFTDRSLNLFGGCFHISQFAELCERNNIVVAPAAM